MDPDVGPARRTVHKAADRTRHSLAVHGESGTGHWAKRNPIPSPEDPMEAFSGSADKYICSRSAGLGTIRRGPRLIETIINLRHGRFFR